MVNKLIGFLSGNKIKSSILAALVLYTCTHRSNTFIENRVVKLFSSAGSCSGEQIKAPSGESYILTAAHCLILQDDKGYIAVKTEDGRIIKRRVIAEDAFSDLLLLEGVPGLEGLKIAHRAGFKEHVRSFTHGHGLDTYETEGILIQTTHIDVVMNPELCLTGMPKYVGYEEADPITGIIEQSCLMRIPATITTASVVPGSSGGPVVDVYGSLVGVVSAGDGVFGYLVTLDDIHNFISNY